MKNKYLGGLRKEYAVDSATVNECISNIDSWELQKEQREWVNKLKKYWELVDLAFRYGNSFY